MTNETQGETQGETQSQSGMSRRDFVRGAAGVAASVAGAAAVAVLVTRGGGADALVAHHRAGELPLDPGADAWLELPSFAVALLPQNITTPLVLQAAIDGVAVRSLHNGTHLAFHLEWQDAEASERHAVAQFRDAVAVLLPTDPAAQPAVTMGDVDNPVYLLHWKANVQADLDDGRATIKDLFPNSYNDVVPESIMSEADAKVFSPGLYVGNHESLRDLRSPVEELTARGFGSATTHETQSAQGRGEYARGRWRVVIAFEMQGGNLKAKLTPGTASQAGFAVWSGSKQQRGARKQFAGWIPFDIEVAS